METGHPPLTLDQIAAALANQPQFFVPFEKQLWNAEQCAKYLGKTYKTFMNSYAPLPSFPKRISLPRTDGGKSCPLWRANEIEQWALKYQEKDRRNTCKNKT